MCSISGFLAASPLSPSTAQRLADALLFFGRFRGRQSGGAALLFPNHPPLLKKRALDPAQLINDPDFDQAFRCEAALAQGIKGALLHTRQPTCGGRGDEQAQPFLIQDNDSYTITTHNGYYHDFEAIKAAHSITKPSGVDSELAASYIHRHGALTLPDFIKSTDGPSSIAAYHASTLYFIRAGNPLSYSFIDLADSNRLIIWASTPDILRQALSYTWLFDTLPQSHTTTEGLLYSATPDAVTPLTTTPVSYTALTLRSYSPGRAYSWDPDGDYAEDHIHDCPYAKRSITFYSSDCRCILAVQPDGTRVPRPNPNYPPSLLVAPSSTPPPPPAQAPADDNDAEEELEDDDEDAKDDASPFVTADDLLSFWLTDAIAELTPAQRTEFRDLLLKSLANPEELSRSQWRILGRYWPLIIEAGNA